MIHRFDLWLGKTMFIPIAIRICQRLHISQYALHTYIWLFVFFYAVYRGPHAYGTGLAGWLFYGLVVLFAALWTLIAALVPESTRRSTSWVRHLFVFLMLSDIGFFLPALALAHEPLTSTVIQTVKDWFVVLAEYALTITTIPPLEAKEKKASGKLARQES
jgi:hypothetical protein